LGMVSMPMRLLRILRWIGLGVVGLIVALFVVVQGQQRLLRHRAGRLHAEIVALQMHPGTFADVQRMQQEWGKFGHWDGECTAHHCIYTVLMTDWLGNFLYKHDLASWVRHAYSWSGATEVIVDADVRLRNDRMWGEDFSVMVGDSNLWVRMYGGSHLFGTPGEIRASALKQEHRAGFEGACTGCIGAEIFVTPDTPPSDVGWLTDINFSCLTRWHPCESEDDLIPRAWSRREKYDDMESRHDWNLNAVSVKRLGQEADQAALIEIEKLFSLKDSPEDSYADVRILTHLKNGDQHQIGSIVSVEVAEDWVARGSEEKAKLLAGKRFILAYRDERMGTNWSLLTQAIIPATPTNLAEFQAGIANDPSVGEHYEWRRFQPVSAGTFW